MSDLHVVLGASGGVGSAITRALVGRGILVRAVNRAGSVSGAGIEPAAGDVRNPVDLARVVDGAAIVYMAAQPPYHRWSEEFPAMLAGVVDAAAAAGARLVMVDNLYAYGPGAGPMSESTPERAVDAKGVVRREMAAALLEVDRAGRLPVLVGRLSDYFGPDGDGSVISALAFAPLQRRKPIRWPFRLDAPHSAAYLPDVGRAFVDLGTTSSAFGRVWVLPHAPAMTGGSFIDSVGLAVDGRARTRALRRGMFRLMAPVHRPSRELLAIRYQFEEPFVVDDTAFRAAFPGFTPTPLEQAISDTASWYLDREPVAA